jgi:uncharacterized membrane protein
VGEYARRARAAEEEELAAPMNRNPYARIAAIVVGAAVIFGLEQGLGVKLYFAIPAGIVAYIGTLLAANFMLGAKAD